MRSMPPELRRIEIAINRNGRLDPTGLPSAGSKRSSRRRPPTRCGPAKVGEGAFSADAAIPESSPFPSQGRLVAFNGIEHGRPVILAHVYGTDPVPTSYTLTLRITGAKGTFGTVPTASLPQVTTDTAFVTGITLKLDRRFRYRGERRGYLSAGCPAPKGFPGAVFPLGARELLLRRRAHAELGTESQLQDAIDSCHSRAARRTGHGGARSGRPACRARDAACPSRVIAINTTVLVYAKGSRPPAPRPR
jgi:hypothetical protein